MIEKSAGRSCAEQGRIFVVLTPARYQTSAASGSARHELARSEDDLLAPGSLGDGAQVVQWQPREQAKRDRHRRFGIAHQGRADDGALSPLGMLGNGLERLRRERIELGRRMHLLDADARI